MRVLRGRFTVMAQTRSQALPGQARWWVHLAFFLAARLAIRIILPVAVYDSEVHRCGTSESAAISLLWLIGIAYVIALLLTHRGRETSVSKPAVCDPELDGMQ
jgi:hypothetical protein